MRTTFKSLMMFLAILTGSMSLTSAPAAAQTVDGIVLVRDHHGNRSEEFRGRDRHHRRADVRRHFRNRDSYYRDRYHRDRRHHNRYSSHDRRGYRNGFLIRIR